MHPPPPLFLDCVTHIVTYIDFSFNDFSGKDCFYLRRWPDFCVVFRGGFCFSCVPELSRPTLKSGFTTLFTQTCFSFRSNALMSAFSTFSEHQALTYKKKSIFTCLWKLCPWRLVHVQKKATGIKDLIPHVGLVYINAHRLFFCHLSFFPPPSSLLTMASCWH